MNIIRSCKNDIAIKKRYRGSYRIKNNLLPVQSIQRSQKRAITLTHENISTIISEISKVPKVTSNSPPMKSSTIESSSSIIKRSNSLKLFPITLKRRFKNLDINSKRIPQTDHMIFVMEKIPTFDFVREKNLRKNKTRILKDINPIFEDQNEYNYE